LFRGSRQSFGVRKTFRATERCDRGPVAGRRQPVRCLTNLRLRRYAVGMFYLKALSLVALLAIEMPFAASAANPPKLAAQARLDLTSATVRLEKGELLAGSGKVERMNWAKGEAKTRGYTANFAISHYAWTEAKMRFVPDADGSVELKLMGAVGGGFAKRFISGGSALGLVDSGGYDHQQRQFRGRCGSKLDRWAG